VSEFTGGVAFRPLRQTFYVPSARRVAPRLLGHLLVRRSPEGLTGGIIVETEAYLAHDPSCHGYARQTARNRSMFGPPGHAYVYFIYGNHYCFNAVCGHEGVAEAVLVRAIEPTLGLDLMEKYRPCTDRRQLTSGPGKFCSAMRITRELDGVDLCSVDSPIFIAENRNFAKFRRSLGPVVRTPRIGISVAAHWLLRYYLSSSQFVSRGAVARRPARRPWQKGRARRLVALDEQRSKSGGP
jgi:DNA-3-methyladenine glycosylase